MRVWYAGPATLLALVAWTAGCEGTLDEPQFTPADREAIVDIATQIEELGLAGDWDGFFTLFHTDAIVIPPGLPAIEGRDEIQRWWLEVAEGMTYLDFSVEPIEVYGSGDLAFAWYEYYLEFEDQTGDDSVTQELQGDWLFIFRKDEDGNWLIFRETYRNL